MCFDKLTFWYSNLDRIRKYHLSFCAISQLLVITILKKSYQFMYYQKVHLKSWHWYFSWQDQKIWPSFLCDIWISDNYLHLKNTSVISIDVTLKSAFDKLTLWYLNLEKQKSTSLNGRKGKRYLWLIRSRSEQKWRRSRQFLQGLGNLARKQRF